MRGGPDGRWSDGAPSGWAWREAWAGKGRGQHVTSRRLERASEVRIALGRGRDTEKVTEGILCPPAPLLGPPELATAQTLSLRASREESGVVHTIITTASIIVNTNTLKWRGPFSPAGPDFVCSLGQVSPCHCHG